MVEVEVPGGAWVSYEWPHTPDREAQHGRDMVRSAPHGTTAKATAW